MNCYRKSFLDWLLNTLLWVAFLFGAMVLISYAALGAVGGTTAASITAKVKYANSGANLFAVKTAAPDGTTIIVGPGLYTVGVTNLLKNGVNWLFYPGAVVSNGLTGNVGSTWDNSAQGTSGAITSVVAGAALFIDANGGSDGATFKGMLNITDAASRIKFQCRELRSVSDQPNSAAFATIFVDDCSLLELDVDASVTTAAGALCVYWNNGTARGRIGHISGVSASALWCEGTGAADWILDIATMSTPQATCVYFAPTHIDNKLWVKNFWTYGGSAGGLNYGAALTIHGGKFYFESEKLWGNWGGSTVTGPIIHQQGGISWMRTLKMSITNNQDFVEQTGGYMRLECKDWEDNVAAGGSRPYCNLISGGTNEMSGNAITKFGPFAKLTGGQLYMERMRVNTFNTLAPSNSCLWIVGAGVPVLDNCTFIPGSIFSVSNPAAGDLRILGTLSTKSNITATLTARGGVVDVDTFFDR